MSSNNYPNKYPTYITYDTSSTTNTTFVQADPSNFRSIVQELTGSSASHHTTPAGRVSEASERRKTESFKLHERRQGAMRKLEMIKLNNVNNYHNNGPGVINNNYYYHGPGTNGLIGPRGGNNNYNDVGGCSMISPVSTLDGLGLGLGSPSPRGCVTMMSEDEERAVVVEKGFYLHPVRVSEPQLLPLFPLHSPRDN